MMVMGELTTYAEVAVLGGGPGGYTAAIRAAQLGKEVVLIEKGALGGICTNVGCIPSKALIHASDIFYKAKHSKEMGIEGKVKLDFKKLQEWQKKIVKELSDGIRFLCERNGIEIIKGRGFFISPNEIEVETESGMRKVKFKNAVIASGSRVRELKGFEYNEFRISSDDVFSLEELPQTLAIVGGGYIACEMANLFAKLGSEVHIIYRGERLLKRFAEEVSREVEKGLEELGVKIHFNKNVVKAEKGAVVLDGGMELLCDKVLFAVGREAVLDIGLEKARVGYDKYIKVNERMQTNQKHIYAVGDAVGGKALAHKAFKEGKVAAENIAGQNSVFDNVVPEVVFTHPQVAAVGEFEGLQSVKYPLKALGAAKTYGEDRGFIKIFHKDGVLRGAQIVGKGAAEVISEITLALEMGAMVEDVALTIHPHPTLPEMFSESCEFALGKAIHWLKLG